MKKRNIIIACLLFILILFTTKVNAAEEACKVSLSADKTTLGPGDTVTVSIKVSNVTKTDGISQFIGALDFPSDIFEIVFGGVHTFAEKRKFIRENELIAFKNNINKKINSIPINKLKKPDIDVVGPILEASKYYFKNEEIRKLFENLLVSSSS